MRYVMQYGNVYRLSNRNYRKLVRDGLEGNIAGWDYYKAKLVATDVDNILDWGELDWESACRREGVRFPAGYIPD